MLRSIDISTSGLVAQRQRLNTIAGNIANVNTTHAADGKAVPYQRRFVTFATDTTNLGNERGGLAVDYRVEIDSHTPPRRVYEPGSKYSDAEGYVAYPNINLVTEFVNAMEASRAYEANVVAIQLAKQMSEQTMKILA